MKLISISRIVRRYFGFKPLIKHLIINKINRINMRASMILRYPKVYGLASVLEITTQKVIENKGKVSTTGIVVAETINAISTGDIIMPEVPFAADPMFNSIVFREDHQTINNNNHIQAVNNAEEVNSVSNSSKATEKEKLQEQYIASLDVVGPSYIVRINNTTTDESAPLNLKKPDARIYYTTYDSSFNENPETPLEERKIKYRGTYEDSLNTRIINITTMQEYNIAVMTVNYLTFAFPMHVTERTFIDIEQYINNLITLIESKQEFNYNTNTAATLWVKQKRDFMAKDFNSCLNGQELKSLRDSNVNEILREHHQLFSDAAKEYADRSQENSSSDSFRGRERILELQGRTQRLQEMDLFSEEIKRAQKELVNTARQDLNSAQERCTEMAKKTNEDVNNIVDDLKVHSKLKLSLIIGAGTMTGVAIIGYFITNKKTVSILISSGYKLLFGAAKKAAFVIKETAKTKVAKKVTENMANNISETVTNNANKIIPTTGTLSVGLFKLIEKIIKNAKK